MAMFTKFLLILAALLLAMNSFGQTPPIGPGVSHDLAIWRAEHYSDVRYKLNLTLEKMSPVLKGTIEIRVKVGESRSGGVGETALPGTQAPSPANAGSSGVTTPIVLDWRRIAGHEKDSTIRNVTINGTSLDIYRNEAYHLDVIVHPYVIADQEHLIFNKGVKPGENVIKLDFTSPILTSGSAITRYVDKEDGAEYIYSLFVPSDASTAFPVFDQPDLKARFSLDVVAPKSWNVVGNTDANVEVSGDALHSFEETRPLSTYVFAFAAGPFSRFSEGQPSPVESGYEAESGRTVLRRGTIFTPAETLRKYPPYIFVRRSQAAKFQPHAAEVFRLTREGIKYLETYFDYKFPFPKYDLVLIPEFPFGGMEHAGATFLRESSVIFPQEPTKSDYISRANLIFHETAHQWFGDTVTMKWFDDLWLKEGFAEFMAYKTLEHVMPDANAWKVFYERNKQAAYATDSTKGTTPIYQTIDNLSAAKSAYGNIVYRKAPSFLRQAEFYLGEDKFQTAVRAFLKKHDFANAGWEDLVKEMEAASGQELRAWANDWITKRGVPLIRVSVAVESYPQTERIIIVMKQSDPLGEGGYWKQRFKAVSFGYAGGPIVGDHFYIHSVEFDPTPVVNGVKKQDPKDARIFWTGRVGPTVGPNILRKPRYVLPNYEDRAYGVFLLDPASQKYFLNNVSSIDDPFVRSTVWGTLWDSVREGELDPKEYVELVVKNIATEQDETIVSSILGRASTAMNYYLSEPPAVAGGLTRSTADAAKTKTVSVRPGLTNADLQPPATAGGSDLRTRLEDVLIERMRQAPTLGQRITFYRAFLNIAAGGNARNVLKQMLKSVPPAVAGGVSAPSTKAPPATAGGTDMSGAIPLRTKDRFDIVTRLIILGDPDAEKLLADLEKAETSDDAKRYAYAARAAFPTKENREKFWSDFVNNKDISESWIEAVLAPFNSIRHDDLSLPYLQRALAELPNLKRNRKIFFVNGWLGAFIGGQRSEEALNIVNKFLADNPKLDNDLRLKILENVDLIERAVKIRKKFSH